MDDLLRALLDSRLAFAYIRRRSNKTTSWVEFDVHTARRKVTYILDEDDLKTKHPARILTRLAKHALAQLGDDDQGVDPLHPELDLE